MNPHHQHERKQKKNTKRILMTILLALIGIAIFLGIWAIFGSLDSIPENTLSDTSAQESEDKKSDSIAIPGYEGITLKADSLEQTVALKNPEQNSCYFLITLSLEDGTILWKSNYIKPGETSSPIVLNQFLEKGNYPNAVLHYSCFKMDSEKTPLNGAETKLTLRVK